MAFIATGEALSFSGILDLDNCLSEGHCSGLVSGLVSGHGKINGQLTCHGFSLVCNKPAVAVATPVSQFVRYGITLRLLRVTHVSAFLISLPFPGHITAGNIVAY